MDDLYKIFKKILINKDFVIILLLISIAFVSFYEKIIPLFIEFNFDYINNIVMFIPIILLILLILLSIFSKFKFFSKDALFNFNHTFLNKQKYDTIINEHIENYRSKIINITHLHNKELLKTSTLKEQLSNKQQYFEDIKTIINNLRTHCNKINNYHNEELNIFTDNVDKHIDKMSDKASEIWNTY